MFKVIVWTAALSSACTAALLVPIDPSVLESVGLGSITPPTRSGGVAQVYPPDVPRKAITNANRAADPNPTSRMMVRVVPAAASTNSPYSSRNTVTGSARPVYAGLSTMTSSDTPSWATAWSAVWNGGRAQSEEAPVPPAITAPPPIEVRRLAIAAAPRVQPISSFSDRRSRTTVDLVDQLQTELQRVGCYNGRIDGDWGPASRFAMAEFVKAVNAALPTERPDEILLSLVRRHAGVACGSNPSGSIIASTTTTRPRSGDTSDWKVRITSVAPTVTRIGTPEPTGTAAGNSIGSGVRIIAAPRVLPRSAIQPAASGFAELAQAPRRQSGSDLTDNSLDPRFSQNRMSLGVVGATDAETPEPAIVAPVPTRSEFRRQHTTRGYVPSRSRQRFERRQRRTTSSRRARSKRWRDKFLQTMHLSSN